MKVKTLALLLPLFASSAFAATLQLDVYNPQDKAIFPVSSTLVSGPKEAILFDAQFSTKDGEQLVQMIRASGKTLKAIVITSGDPDFYRQSLPTGKSPGNTARSRPYPCHQRGQTAILGSANEGWCANIAHRSAGDNADAFHG